MVHFLLHNTTGVGVWGVWGCGSVWRLHLLNCIIIKLVVKEVIVFVHKGDPAFLATGDVAVMHGF